MHLQKYMYMCMYLYMHRYYIHIHINLYIIYKQNIILIHIEFSSVIQSYPNLCDPMNCSTPGLPDHHHLPELTQTHVH